MEATRSTLLLYRLSRHNINQSIRQRTHSGPRQDFLSHRLSRFLPLRSVSTSASSHQQAAATAERTEDTEEVEKEDHSPQPRSQKSPSYESLLDSWDSSIPTSTAHQRSEADELRAMGRALEPSGRTPRAHRNQPPTIDTERMNVPSHTDFSDLFAQPGLKKTPLSFQGPVQQDIFAPPFRMGPTLGRTVKIGDDGDLARGFRQLDLNCARNRVRSDFNKQRFHERPGLKRKRLHSERWRRRFKADFQAVCSRVEELRRKGW